MACATVGRRFHQMGAAFRASPVGAFTVAALVSACAATPDIVYEPDPPDAASDGARTAGDDGAADAATSDAQSSGAKGKTGSDANACKAEGEKCTASSECCEGRCQSEDWRAQMPKRLSSQRHATRYSRAHASFPHPRGATRGSGIASA